jgi:mannose-6-phosphate isomerase-like protein (cupin superfamily)
MAKRVVTGHADGRSVFVDEGDIEDITLGLMPGLVFRMLWDTPEQPTVPNTAPVDTASEWFPQPGGVRVAQVVFPGASAGGGVPPDDLESAAAEFEAKLPGLLGAMEPDDPGMHTSDTVDVGIVMSGELWLELDDGAERHLTAGDVVIQNGTRHRWQNRSSEPCLMTFVLVGAHRA